MTDPRKILLAEDEPAIVELLRYNLASAGFEVIATGDGRMVCDLARGQQPGLILLDWMLPNLSGAEICERLRDARETRNIPVIMVTARGEEQDKITALNAGADDYVTKPFSPPELLARIRAVLRRTAALPQAPAVRSLVAGPLAMDLAQRRASNAGIEVRLGPTEFRLLKHFMEHPGEVYSREQLLDSVWEKDVYVEPRTVDVHIRRLRKALNDEGDPGLIRTVRSAGYALNVPNEKEA